MDIQKLVGMRVMNISTHAIGTIEYIKDGIVAIDYYGIISKYSYPSAFAGLLELEDISLSELYNRIKKCNTNLVDNSKLLFTPFDRDEH